MNFKIEFLKAIGINNAYGFIAEHYWEMDKETLRDICLECIYELLQNDSDIDVVVENLTDLWYNDIENRIKELKVEIEYEENKLDCCGFGTSDLMYIESLKNELHELNNRIWYMI